MKVVVFDLDETIGNFEQLGILWDAIESNQSFHRLSRPDLFHIIDLFPKIFRPDFFNIIKDLKTNHVKTAIFTNNQGPPEWVSLFAEYTSYKIGHHAFNRIVRSWKIGKNVIEPCRTSYDKKYTDFLTCTGYPENTKLCFLDDQLHDGMKHPNVYYIHIHPYQYHYKFKDMIHKITHSPYCKKLLPTECSKNNQAKNILYHDIQKSVQKYQFRPTKTRIDKTDIMLSNEIKKHIHLFLTTF